jgi:acetyl-CoA synthetase
MRTMNQQYPVPSEFAERAWIDSARYKETYQRSVTENEAFWAEIAERLDWSQFPERVKDVSYRKEDLHIRWF